MSEALPAMSDGAFGDAVLEQLCGQLPQARVPQRATIAKLRYTHEDCIDRILANPGISQNDLAAFYGYSAPWMSVVINSDAFQSLLAERRAELVDPVLRATLNERFRALTVRALEVTMEKLSLPSHQIEGKFALEAAALGAKSLGLGGHSPPPPAPDASGHLAQLANRLVDLQSGLRARPPAAEIVDIEPKAA